MSDKRYVYQHLRRINRVDTTIRNLDPEAYRRLKTWAAARGVAVGPALSELIRARLPKSTGRPKSFADFPIADFGPGSETLSDDIDEILYGG